MTTTDERLQTHLRYAYENAPAVKALFEKVGLTPDAIQSRQDLAKLPITSKDDFSAMQQQNPPFGGWLATPIENLQRIYMSPGPIYDPHGQDDTLARSFSEIFEAAGFGKGDIFINGFLYHMVPAGLVFDEVLRTIGATLIPMGPGNVEIQIKVMMDLNVNGYIGTPSFLAMILDKTKEMNIPKERIPLKKAFFSAEPYLPMQREKFEGEYGMKTYQSYATADLGAIAYQLHGEEGFIIPQTHIVELVDPQTGEWVEEGTPGEVVVTTFNKDYPLLRFGTGDMAVMIPNTNRLAGLVGRSGEAIKVRGMFLHPNQLRFLQTQIEGIKKLQAVITRDGNRDVVTLNIVPVEGASLDAGQIQQTLKAMARLTIDHVEFVDSIEGARTIQDARA